MLNRQGKLSQFVGFVAPVCKLAASVLVKLADKCSHSDFLVLLFSETGHTFSSSDMPDPVLCRTVACVKG